MTDNNKIQPISIERLPSVVKTQINEMEELSNQIQQCIDDAAKARMKADTASSKTVGTSWRSFVPFVEGNKTIAIESLQDAMRQMGIAQVSMATAINLVFDNQKKLSQVAQYLVSLGITSIAHNRVVVRELKLRLENASDSEINELEKQEINNVIAQLESQVNLQNKVDEKVEQITILQKQVNALLVQLKEREKSFFDTVGFKIFLLVLLFVWILAIVLTNIPGVVK